MTINSSLPAEMEARVREHVASGLYGSASEVVREALRLFEAYQAVKTGGTLPAVLSGANEEAVEAFLEEKIKFDRIVPEVEEVLSKHLVQTDPGIEEILLADLWARREAARTIEGMKN